MGQWEWGWSDVEDSSIAFSDPQRSGIRQKKGSGSLGVQVDVSLCEGAVFFVFVGFKWTPEKTTTT